eukprot:1640880-Pyramimonas_sp.AAC.1
MPASTPRGSCFVRVAAAPLYFFPRDSTQTYARPIRGTAGCAWYVRKAVVRETIEQSVEAASRDYGTIQLLKQNAPRSHQPGGAG